MKKKILAVILTAAMVSASISPVFGAEFSGVAEKEAAEEILEVVSPDDEGTEVVPGEMIAEGDSSKEVLSEDVGDLFAEEIPVLEEKEGNSFDAWNSNALEAKQVKEMKIVKEPRKTVFWYGLEDLQNPAYTGEGICDRLQVNVTYTDGSTYLIDFKDVFNDASDPYENCYQYILETEDGKLAGGANENLPLGNYRLYVRHWKDTSLKTSNYVSIRVAKPSELLELVPELRISSDGAFNSKQELISGNKIICKIIPDTTGIYEFSAEGNEEEGDTCTIEMFDSDCNYVYTAGNTNNQYQLEEGAVYFLRCTTDAEIGSEIYFRTKPVKGAESKGIESVKIIQEPAEKVMYRYIDTSIYSPCLSGIKIEVAYQDGKTEVLSLDENKVTSNGLCVTFEWNYQGNKNNAPAGLYTVNCVVGGKKAAIDGVELKELDDYPTLEVEGSITVKRGCRGGYDRGDYDGGSFLLKTGARTEYAFTNSDNGLTFLYLIENNKVFDPEMLWSSDSTVTLKPNSVYYVETKQISYVDYEMPPEVTIEARAVSSLSNCTITGPTSAYYTGKAITRTITIKDGSTVLTLNKDYKLSYSNNKNPGTATVTIEGIGSYAGSITKNFRIYPAKGKIYTVGALKYKVLGTSEVQVVGPKATTYTGITIPTYVKIYGFTYKVKSIAANAFKGCTSLKKVVVGNHVTHIYAGAFYGCSSLSSITLGINVTHIYGNVFYGCKALKTITINSTKLSAINKLAFRGMYAKAVIKVPSSKLAAYKKLLKGRGQASTVTIR